MQIKPILAIIFVMWYNVPQQNRSCEFGQQLRKIRPKSDYEQFFDNLMQREGYYYHFPAASGGRTKYGITENFLKHTDSKLTIQLLTKREAMRLTKEYFWNEIRADKIENDSVRDMVVDWFFMSGTRAVKEIQRICGLKQTGHCDIKIPMALNEIGASVYGRIKQRRLELAKKSVYCKGLINRIKNINHEK